MTFDILDKYDDLINLYTKRPFSLVSSELRKQKELDETTIEKWIGMKFKYVKMPKQTHTDKVVVLDENNIEEEFDDVDGFVTNLKDVAILTTSADCQNILIYDPVNKVIGNVHSGWKGTVKKVVINALNIMIDKFNCKPENIIVCISPSILKCCFEVEDDVVSLFKEAFDNIDEDITLGDVKEGKQKYYIDTVNINIKEMMKLGLKKENIVASQKCTMCNSLEYHSFRKDKENSGRNVALICMK